MSIHPIRFEQDYVEPRSRLTTFFRLILALPHFIVLSFYGLAAFVGVVVAWFALVFTGRWPRGLYAFVAGFARYSTAVSGYAYLLTDKYPPFGPDTDDYPVRLRIGEPKPEYSRLKAGLRLILAIPPLLIAYAMNIVAQVGAFLAWFAIIFLGRQPKALQDMTALGLSYQQRAYAYAGLLDEDWPSFTDEGGRSVESGPSFGGLPPAGSGPAAGGGTAAGASAGAAGGSIPPPGWPGAPPSQQGAAAPAVEDAPAGETAPPPAPGTPSGLRSGDPLEAGPEEPRENARPDQPAAEPSAAAEAPAPPPGEAPFTRDVSGAPLSAAPPPSGEPAGDAAGFEPPQPEPAKPPAAEPEAVAEPEPVAFTEPEPPASGGWLGADEPLDPHARPATPPPREDPEADR